MHKLPDKSKTISKHQPLPTVLRYRHGYRTQKELATLVSDLQLHLPMYMLIFIAARNM